MNKHIHGGFLQLSLFIAAVMLANLAINLLTFKFADKPGGKALHFFA